MSDIGRARSDTGAFQLYAEMCSRAARQVVELLSAMLVLVEVCILFTGVLARYVFHQPIPWSDELASALFLWLIMLGSLIALMRGEHMSMTAFIGSIPEDARHIVDAATYALMSLFLLILAVVGYQYALEESFITTPAMGISNIWRAAAIPVCAAMMILVTLKRLADIPDKRAVFFALAGVGAGTLALYLLSPIFIGLGNLNLIVFFVVGVAGAVCAGVPIAFSFGLATIAYLGLCTDVPMMVIVGRMDDGMGHIILLAVPLFVLLGYLMSMTGMAAAMVQFLSRLLGGVRGGLSYVLIGAMYLVSGISGSKTADMAAIAPALFPEMKARGAKESDLIALLAGTCAQTETIPPSLVLIAISSATGVSIAALFTGGFLPGIVLGATLCVVVWYRSRNDEVVKTRRGDWRQLLGTFFFALPALALPFIIRAAVVEGVATATEVSTIGIVYSVFVGLVLYRKFDWRSVIPILINTAALTGAILLIIGTATSMAWALTQSGFAHSLARAMSSLPGGAGMFLAISILVFILLGSVLEGIPAIVLFGPLLFPIARAMHINEIHYSMVVILAMGLGLFAPPFGVGYYAACAISGVHPNVGMRSTLGYMLVLLIGVVIVAAVPWISIGFL